MEEEIVIIEDDDIEKIDIEEENYSGKPYELPIASADTLGGIKVGENLTIDEDGTLNAQAGGSGSVVGEDKEMIYANLSTLYDESLTPWGRKTIKLDTEISKLGENLKLTNEGRIKIGKGISKISIQCGILASALTNLGIIDFRIYVVRNGEKILINQSYAEFITLKNSITVLGFVPIYNVQENDEIELIYTSNVSGTFRVFQTGTFISVEKVNNTNVVSGNGSSKVGTYIQIYNSVNLFLQSKEVTKLNFDKENKNTTEGSLISENGGVRVGKGVSQLLILAKWNSWIYDHEKFIYVYKNGVCYEMQSYPLNVYSANITSYMDVEEGDFVEIYGYQASSTERKINSNWENTNAKMIVMR